MELHEFVDKLRVKLDKRRAELMESYNKGLDRDAYVKVVGRVAELDSVRNEITTILRTTNEDNNDE